MCIRDKIEAELEALDAFYEVDVASSATLGSHECVWDVTCRTTAGNRDQLAFSVRRDAAGPEDGPSSSAQAGDDTMTVATTTEGRTDIVQSELEALSTIGRVTVSVESAGVKDDGSEGIEWLEKRRTGTCLYRVTFDTNAGDLPMIAICGDPNCAVNHRSNVDGQGVQNFQRGVPDLEPRKKAYPENTLDGAITDSATNPSVTLNTGGLSAGVDDYILIGSEVMLVTKVATNTLTVTRAQDGTTATTHLDAAKVFLLQSSTQQVKETYALPQPESTIATGNAADNGATTTATTIDVTLNTAALDAAVNSYIQIGSEVCLLYTSPSPRDRTRSRMPSSA